MLKYKRILLKVSGEALSGQKESGIDYDIVMGIAKPIKEMVCMGAEVGVVVGAGNFWRGRDNPEMERSRADYMGMVATVLNALAIADTLEKLEVPVRVMTALPMQQVAEPYIRGRAIRHLEKGRVVIFACGTGNPFFSTDTASTLRAAEINADVVFKATMVDGVYDMDPKKHPEAVRYKTLSFTTVLANDLRVIDGTAASMCRENNIPILVFDISEPENMVKALRGEDIGTLITEE